MFSNLQTPRVSSGQNATYNVPAPADLHTCYWTVMKDILQTFQQQHSSPDPAAWSIGSRGYENLRAGPLSSPAGRPSGLHEGESLRSAARPTPSSDAALKLAFAQALSALATDSAWMGFWQEHSLAGPGLAKMRPALWERIVRREEYAQGSLQDLMRPCVEEELWHICEAAASIDQQVDPLPPSRKRSTSPGDERAPGDHKRRSVSPEALPHAATVPWSVNAAAPACVSRKRAGPEQPESDAQRKRGLEPSLQVAPSSTSQGRPRHVLATSPAPQALCMPPSLVHRYKGIVSVYRHGCPEPCLGMITQPGVKYQVNADPAPPPQYLVAHQLRLYMGQETYNAATGQHGCQYEPGEIYDVLGDVLSDAHSFHGYVTCPTFDASRDVCAQEPEWRVEAHGQLPAPSAADLGHPTAPTTWSPSAGHLALSSNSPPLPDALALQVRAQTPSSAPGAAGAPAAPLALHRSLGGMQRSGGRHRIEIPQNAVLWASASDDEDEAHQQQRVAPWSARTGATLRAPSVGALVLPKRIQYGGADLWGSLPSVEETVLRRIPPPYHVMARTLPHGDHTMPPVNCSLQVHTHPGNGGRAPVTTDPHMVFVDNEGCKAYHRNKYGWPFCAGGTPSGSARSLQHVLPLSSTNVRQCCSKTTLVHMLTCAACCVCACAVGVCCGFAPLVLYKTRDQQRHFWSCACKWKAGNVRSSTPCNASYIPFKDTDPVLPFAQHGFPSVDA